MKLQHVFALRDLPPEGRTFTIDDPSIWEKAIEEFSIDCRLTEAPVLELNVLPTDEGWLLRGSLKAQVVVPCSRCACDTQITLDEKIEDYIEMPEADEQLLDKDFERGDDHIFLDHGALLIDFASIAWEQFALSLPPTPLCKENCKGLCPHCGKDLNTGSCSCEQGEGDPRLAILRGLKIRN